LRLLVLTSYATPTNVRNELLVAAVAAGHEVIVVAPERADVMREPLARIGVRYAEWAVNRTGIDPRGDVRAAYRLSRIIAAERPEAILIYQIKAVLLGPLIAKLCRAPHVVVLINGLGTVFDEHGFGLTWKARVARAAYRRALRFADRIVFQNHDDPEFLKRRGVLPAHADWRVVPGSGVDLARLVPAQSHPVVPTFALVSRLLVSKGIPEFVAAARKLRTRYPQARFVLAGQLEQQDRDDAVQKEDLDRWVAEGVIEYAGFVRDIRALLANTTVFVLPSYYREGVPRTNLEALAMGLPVVTTDSVGCRDTVRDGVNGFLIPPRDVLALEERLERYLRQPELAEIHGRASRAFAEETYDIRRVNALMLDALRP
jgi:glycosyltransferase involved in cell wall biosynthesis